MKTRSFTDFIYNLLFLVILFSFINGSFAWKTETHKQILNNAFKILNDDKRQSAEFYKKYQSYINMLNYGMIDPDFSEEKINGTHYYVYKEGVPDTTYLKSALFQYSISARTRFEQHYGMAINQFHNGNFTAAFHSLGRALHYIADTGCPPHSNGIRTRVFRKNVHQDFENFVSIEAHGYSAKTAIGIYEEIKNAKYLGYVMYRIAKDGGIYKNLLETGTKDNYKLIAEKTLPLSQIYTAVILDMFCFDVTENRELKYIKKDTVYKIKNNKTKTYLGYDLEKKNIVHFVNVNGKLMEIEEIEEINEENSNNSNSDNDNKIINETPETPSVKGQQKFTRLEEFDVLKSTEKELNDELKFIVKMDSRGFYYFLPLKNEKLALTTSFNKFILTNYTSFNDSQKFEISFDRYCKSEANMIFTRSSKGDKLINCFKNVIHKKYVPNIENKYWTFEEVTN